jgi:hypothetical protein
MSRTRKRRPTAEDFARFRRKTQENIERTGRSVVGVFPGANSEDPTNDAFAYTIGNALRGLPELLLIGMYGETHMINALSDRMIERGMKFGDGEVVSLGGPHPVRVFDADESVKDQFTIQATNYFGTREYDVMQVVLPDTEGRFPWQAGCAEPYRRVVVHRAQQGALRCS